MRRIVFVGLLIGVASVLGCAESKMSAPMSERGSKDKAKKAARPEAKEAARDEAPPGGGERQDGEVKQDKAEKVARKIVYTGDISLVVEDFDAATEKLEGILALYEGAYIARSEVTGEPNTPRRGTWTIRVPADKGKEFRTDLMKIGEPRKSTLDSRDITDEYYDTKAVIANLEARESALRELYKQKIAGSRLSELLEVDREITSVRGQINVRKGQLARWDKETEFTTFTLAMVDRRGYVPPESPAFSSRIGRTFSGSLELMLDFGKAIVLIVVAVGPWLVLLAVPVGLLWWVIRGQTRSTVGVTRKAPPPVPLAEVFEDEPNQSRTDGVTGRE